MFENIETYIERSQEDRQRHLDLSSDCIEIGGYDSREYRGLLAHHLGTTIPTGKKVVLCHSCHNGKCSNPKRLYWGTYKENMQDTKDNGTFKSIYDKTLAKYGEDGLREIQSKAGRAGGKANAGKMKISLEQLEDYRKKLDTIDQTKRGWVGKAATLLGISHTHIRRIVKRLETIPK